MSKLNYELMQTIVAHQLSQRAFQGNFGLEKENVRVDGNGKLAMTPHPEAFGKRRDHPYIKTDFSESQVEMVTPVYETIEETYHFLEALHDIVTLELKDEWLWPGSNPPALPSEEDIPIARMDDQNEDDYRKQLGQKYGRKKQLLSGIHFNFSFREDFLSQIYKIQASGTYESYRHFKDELYLKVARNLLKNRWLLIYLTGASPVFDISYLERCVAWGQPVHPESRTFPHMNSLRNSICGYRNERHLGVSYRTIQDYVRDLRQYIDSGRLISAKEYYSPVRLKGKSGVDHLQSLLDEGIAYMELRMIDLNPLFKNGISLQILQFIHLFIVYSLFQKDETYDSQEQLLGNELADRLLLEGLQAPLTAEGGDTTLQLQAESILNDMMEMIDVLKPGEQSLPQLIHEALAMVQSPELSYASIIKSEIMNTSYLSFHLERAKQYAKMSAEKSYKFPGYGDLELSTQLLLKAAVRRGVSFELLDRDENFVALKKGDQIQYVKQATKTSLDSYSTVLLMENKIVTKKVLSRHEITVPEGNVYCDIKEALNDYSVHQHQQIIIKPKSTNFGVGITIFTQPFTIEDYHSALEIAFVHDQTVLIESFVKGKEYRFLVMGDEVIGILHRVPANVTGDGIHTIEQLVDRKNLDPLRGKGYKTPLERITLGETERVFLKLQSRSITDVPQHGEVVYLRENSNISTGGDSIDYTDDIPASYHEIAIRAAKAAGATFCGVDMIIENIDEQAAPNNYSVIEINFNPAIHIHCYPYQGKNRKANEKILDLLFDRTV